MTRRRISTRERVEIFKRENGTCYLCGGKISAGEAWDIEHETPLAMGGDDHGDNLRVAHKKCHAGKTARDLVALAKAKRIEARHIGAEAPPSRPIKSRGFPKTRRRKPATDPLTKQLPPRRQYE